MIAIDEDALICDFAETYQIYDYRALPIGLAAVLASGMGDDSRVKKKISKNKADTNTMLLAVIADRLGTIAWMLSEDGRKGDNKPESIYRAIAGTEADEEGGKALFFNSPEEFERERKRILEEVK